MTFEQMREQQLEIAKKAVFQGSLEPVKRFVAVDMSAFEHPNGGGGELSFTLTFNIASRPFALRNSISPDARRTRLGKWPALA